MNNSKPIDVHTNKGVVGRVHVDYTATLLHVDYTVSSVDFHVIN